MGWGEQHGSCETRSSFGEGIINRHWVEKEKCFPWKLLNEWLFPLGTKWEVILRALGTWCCSGKWCRVVSCRHKSGTVNNSICRGSRLFPCPAASRGWPAVAWLPPAAEASQKKENHPQTSAGGCAAARGRSPEGRLGPRCHCNCSDISGLQNFR